MTELKPCPFCKNQNAPKLSSCIDVEACVDFEACEDDGAFCICCDYNEGGCGASSGFRFTKEEAIEAWNTRAERTCKPLYFEYGEEAHCSECGRRLHYDEHTERDYPPYCGCGAKVVE